MKNVAIERLTTENVVMNICGDRNLWQSKIWQLKLMVIKNLATKSCGDENFGDQIHVAIKNMAIEFLW